MLPDRMQQVAKLKFLHDYKYSEILEELNISVNTVKTQFKKVKANISELIKLVLVLLGVDS